MSKTTRDLILIVLFCLVSTFLIWLPHILSLSNFWGLNFSNGFNTIYRNFDGLEYIIIAKTFYDPQIFTQLPQSLPATYFASHFPGYSIFIAIFAPLLGYLKSMLVVSVFFTIASAIAFYFLLKDFKLTSQPLFLSILFLILPARWLIVHSVGSSEPTFIFFLITSVYFLMKFENFKKYYFLILSAIFATFAQITRPPGILLFIALALYIHYKVLLDLKVKDIKSALQHLNYFPYLLIPLSLLGIFLIFQNTLGDFWAYFHSGDNIHLTFPPLQVFNKSQLWVGDIWLEDIFLNFTLGFLGGVILIKRKLYILGFLILTYLSASVFVAHRDISRYILPITPFVLVAFEKVLTSREFKIILPVVAIAAYLYTQNFIIHNVAPYPNPYLFN